ncbi:AfsR/SARP family transcriptional regulator [Streptomyces abyssomicinicus]|uniref:AfsR/SARP family transcriptional regulator n=1 Tax=Streptomyces abyssomicinicus TaxID=574929 RepID=UPI00124FB31A|nr:AfsR/SARP family transcriptional regulator [Streptomyces abyssomicinicus]
MKFEILGRLRVLDGDRYLVPSAHKVRALLSALLIRANEVVSAEQLMYEVWDENPPRRARAALHVYVSQLRKLLADPDVDDNPILTQPPGYLIRVPCGDLDLNVFRRLTQQGRAHVRAQRYEEATVALQSALDLLHGEELDRLQGGSITTGFVTWLKEVRLESLEMLIESNLALGRHRESVSTLQSLTARYPLHEAFYRQLMIALYRSDRRAEALRTYQTARNTLRAELGLDPCAALFELQHAILLADDRLYLRPAV